MDKRVVTAEQKKEEDRLVRENLPLVRTAVNAMAMRVPAQVSRDDLESAGMNGLSQAARSFDPARGVTFARYGKERIWGAMLDELRSRDWTSRGIRQQTRRMKEQVEQLTSELGRSPERLEIADRLGMDPGRLDRLVVEAHMAVVLNYESVVPAQADDILPTADPGPEEQLLGEERLQYLTAAVNALPERLRQVVTGYFLDGRLMQEIAAELGVTESRVSQMRGEALALMKDGMNSQLEPEAVPVEVRPIGVIARRRAAYYAGVAANYRQQCGRVALVS